LKRKEQLVGKAAACDTAQDRALKSSALKVILVCDNLKRSMTE